MGTTTRLVLLKRLAEMAEGDDFVEVAVTTDINNDNTIVSTELRSYDYGTDGYYDPWWVYITNFANSAKYRKIDSGTTYATATGTLTVRGEALADDTTDTATIRMTRINPALYLFALNEATRDIYPHVVQYKDDITLITGNLLPNAHFEDQAVSGTADGGYGLTNATAVADTTAADIRGGAKSLKVTATAASGMVSLHSDNYPQLLDIAGKGATLKVWALPQTADDPTIQIYTKTADGTAQSALISTTEAPAGEFTLLELKDQTCSSALVEVEIRFLVATSTQYVIFDDARLTTSFSPKEYRLPTDFHNGAVRRVDIQTKGFADDACDDLNFLYYDPYFGFTTTDDGTKLRLENPGVSNRRIRVRGDYPLSTLDTDTATIPTDNAKEVNLFLKYAEYKLFESLTAAPDSTDTSRYERAAGKALGEYYRMLPNSKMTRTQATLNIGRY